jgi:dihydroorotate dehydrogenase (NAD+) catalytic subunit
MPTPVMIASGIYGYGEELKDLAGLEGVGAFVLKTVTPRPRLGNPPHARIVETPAGIINSIGLENPGIEAFLAEKLPAARRLGVPLVASIAGETDEEFADLARRMDGAEDVAALELNISCPNVERGGMLFGCDPALAAGAVAAARAATGMTLIAKLTPNVTDIAQVARACEEAGADAVSLVNTFSAMAIDVETRRPLLGGNFGGLSGPAIRPAAVLRVYQVARAVEVPVIGMGGVWEARDALEFIIAGAAAVGVGTVLYSDPGRPRVIVAGIRDFLAKEGIADIADLVGTVRLNP